MISKNFHNQLLLISLNLLDALQVGLQQKYYCNYIFINVCSTDYIPNNSTHERDTEDKIEGHTPQKRIKSIY